MENKDFFNEQSKYAMGLIWGTHIAGNHIPLKGNLVSTVSIRMQMLIPQLHTEDFYRLSIVDSFNINNIENGKYEVQYNPQHSITLLLLKKRKGSNDDITNKADILFSINSISSSDFLLDKCIFRLKTFLNDEKNLRCFFDLDDEPTLHKNIINKESLLEISENIKQSISSFLKKIYANDIAGLIKDYNYIETYSLRGITEAIHENDKLYEIKLNHEHLQLELNGNKLPNNKKIKL